MEMMHSLHKRLSSERWNRFSLSARGAGGEGRGEISPNEFAHCASERGAGTARPRALKFDGFAIWGRAVPTPVHGEVGLSLKLLRFLFVCFVILSVKILFFCANFLPTLPADVAQSSNLLYRRIAFGRAPSFADMFDLAAASGLQIRDTAESNSALPRFRLCRAGYIVVPSSRATDLAILKPDDFSNCIAHFNAMEDENVTNAISNEQSWSWLEKEIPFFECPDREVEQMYYYRWWSFRKHLEQTTNGFVFSEFLTRQTPVSSALGHQIADGRWLHDQKYIDDYVRYWFRDDVSRLQLHKYSSWLAAALWQRYLVTGDKEFVVSQLDNLVRDYRQWEQERLATNGLFWQYDVRDAMEESISGSRTNKNLRPTINSYMFGNARAIAAIARLAGKKKLADEFDAKAAQLKKWVQEQLWNPNAQFFEVRRDDGRFSNVREEMGFIPWMFELPDDDRKFAAAWSQLADSQGFFAPYGITTAERRHPQFRTHGYGHCEWDGAVWPFATSQTLDALANYLRATEADSRVTHHASRVTYFDAFLTYTHSQHADGKPYVGEYLDETTGQWINGKNDRSRYYNHSTYADLIVTGVVGLVPRADDVVEIFPLLPQGVWNYFCLDGIKYHGRTLTILWDADGTHYHHGQGLALLADGKEIARTAKLGKLIGKLP